MTSIRTYLRLRLGACAILLMGSAAVAQIHAPLTDEPPCRTGPQLSLTRKCGAGVLLGLGGAFVGTFTGIAGYYAVNPHVRSSGGFGIPPYANAAIGGFLAGYALCSPLGVYLSGWNQGQHGKYWASLLGSLAGFGIGAAIASRGSAIAVPVGFVSVPLGSLGGYELSRRMGRGR
jgi:hypothetical protein